MAPRMIVVAGPPGSGKSVFLSPLLLQLEYLNADDPAAELNDGSYFAISSKEIQKIVNGEFEAFILGCIERGVMFRQRNNTSE
jgi:predicted kinase